MTWLSAIIKGLGEALLGFWQQLRKEAKDQELGARKSQAETDAVIDDMAKEQADAAGHPDLDAAALAADMRAEARRSG